MSIKHRYGMGLARRGYCNVYSDVAIEELRDWGRSRRLPDDWLQRPPGGIPHYQLYGRYKDLCGLGVTADEFHEDQERWRQWQSKGKTKAARPSQETSG